MGGFAWISGATSHVKLKAPWEAFVVIDYVHELIMSEGGSVPVQIEVQTGPRALRGHL